jgi:hypothetical protein
MLCHTDFALFNVCPSKNALLLDLLEALIFSGALTYLETKLSFLIVSHTSNGKLPFIKM